MPTHVAFLGTGLMGAPMARRLIAAGHSVHVWNRSPVKAAALASCGGIVHASACDAVRHASIVFLCLADADAVEMLLFGDQGIAASLTDRQLVADFSTIGPRASAELSGRLRRGCGARWLDCPVSGGVAGAENGTLAIFAGGAVSDFEQCRPFLEILGSNITYMGGVGAGQAAKLCNQLIVSANLLAIAEAIRLGETLGVDVNALPAALKGGFADSRPLQLFGPRMALQTDEEPPVSELRTMFKDIGEICSEAQRANVALPLMCCVQDLYQQLINAGHGREDLPVLMKLYRNPDRKDASDD